MSYTKLFASILDSTIWQEDLPVKVVWITLLAMADRDGVVEASVPGLARRANVTIEQAEHAIARLSAPDPYSRTKEHEGRRIAELDQGGGWRLLNFEKYRAKLDAEDQRQKAAERQQRKRDREKEDRVKGVTPRDSSRSVTPDRDDVTHERDAQRDCHGPSHRVRHTEQNRSDQESSLSLDQASPISEPDPDPGPIVDLEREPPDGLPLELVPGWRPEPEPIAGEAQALGIDLTAELRKFHDRAKARGEQRVDWQAWWREWVGYAIDFARKQGRKPAHSAPSSDVAARERRAEMERDRAEHQRQVVAAANDRAEVERIAKLALDDLQGVG